MSTRTIEQIAQEAAERYWRDEREYDYGRLGANHPDLFEYIIAALREATQDKEREHAETVRLLSKSAELLKLSADKLHHYAKRQGKTRMAGKTFADGSARNPNEGQHYPAVQSYLDQIRAHLAALQLTAPVKSGEI